MTTPFPPAVPLVQVTGALYGWNGQPRTGRVIFEMTGIAQDPTDKVTIPPARVTAVLGTTSFIVSNGVSVPGNPPGPGCFSVVLVATDYANLLTDTDTAFVYKVTIDLDGDDPVVRYYIVPHTPAVTDISQMTEVGGALSPAAAATPYLPLPSGTPVSGDVPIATGQGEASAWGVISGGGSGLGWLTPSLGFSLATLPGLWAANTGSQASANEVVLTLATAQVSGTITKLGTWIGGAGATPGSGINGLAIYTEAGVLLDQTVDMTAAFEVASSWAEASLTAGVSIVQGTNYYLAFMHNFSTAPAMPGFVPPPGQTPLIHGHYPHVYIAPVVTAFPASFTPANVGLNGSHWFLVAGSP